MGEGWGPTRGGGISLSGKLEVKVKKQKHGGKIYPMTLKEATKA